MSDNIDESIKNEKEIYCFLCKNEIEDYMNGRLCEKCQKNDDHVEWSETIEQERCK